MLEPDNDDQFLTQSVFADENIDIELEFFNYSNEMLESLSGAIRESYPQMIIISLRSVPENGLEVLRRLKSHPDFREIPVVVLSEFATAGLVKQCYQMGANSFIQKPDNGEKAISRIRSFLNYWFNVVELAN